MCVRLYPDIIVVAEINNSRLYYGETAPICISIDDCLAHQHDYVSFGIRNAFVGFNEAEWSKSDYVEYFKSLPKFFIRTGDDYLVNVEALKENNTLDETEKAQFKLGKLLTQGVYSPDVLRAFRIAS